MLVSSEALDLGSDTLAFSVQTINAYARLNSDNAKTENFECNSQYMAFLPCYFWCSACHKARANNLANLYI